MAIQSAHHPAENTPPIQLRLFNTLTRQRETFEPLEPGRARMYSCGPTVYRYIHIGNLRTFAMADWLRRTLTYQGVMVTHIKNITDVGHMRQEVLDRGEDKMIAQALREGKTPWEIAEFYTTAFHQDEAALNILPAQVFPRATDHIPEMIALAQRLLERGYAYEAEGNVFFSVQAFPGYGQLSGNRLEHIGQGLRTETELSGLKRAPEDFPLWKLAEPGRMMAWDSPWGRGFPGWHIECSAMSAKYLGEQFDIHTGGIDNLFPHHEDERAQSEAASGKQFVRYWVHAQHLLADGLKMAKSTGNAYTLADIQARGFAPLALRFFFTTAHYRSRINFTFRGLRAAQTGLERLYECAYRLSAEAHGASDAAGELRHHLYARAFLTAVNDDLNLPRAMAVVWAMARDQNAPPETRLALLYLFDEVLGFGLADAVRQRDADRRVWAAGIESPGATLEAERDVPATVLTVARERATARAHRDFAAADTLRGQLAESGYAVRDDATVTRLVPIREREDLMSSSTDVPSLLETPPRFAFSVHLLAHNNYDDLERCVESVCRVAGNRRIELVIVDNGSTDETLPYLRHLQRQGERDGIPVRVFFADHDMGFAAGRNASVRASLGEIVVLLDTSIEVTGDIWTPISTALANSTIGLVGPFGLVTTDLKEYAESNGPDVDAMEGYLMAFRRDALLEVGPMYEKFRFYRLADVDYSLEFKRAGFRVVALPELAERIVQHPHREWHSLTPDEQATKSKKNFDIYWKRRHHAESLLVANYTAGQAAPWGHDHEITPPDEADPRFEHGPTHGDESLHAHEHKHWPDHAHTHAHVHTSALHWHGDGQRATYAGGQRDH